MATKPTKSNKKREEPNILAFAFKSDEALEEYFKNDPTDSEWSREDKMEIKAKLILNQNENGLNTDKDEIEPIDEVNEDGRSVAKTLKQRIFGPVDPGSIRGSIFNMLIMCLGSAILTLPQQFNHVGLFLAMIQIVVIGIASYWTLNLYYVVCDKLNNFSLAEIIRKVCGNAFSKVCDTCVLIFILGILIVYNVVSKFILFNLSFRNSWVFNI